MVARTDHAGETTESGGLKNAQLSVMKSTAEEKQLEGVERLQTQGQKKMTESLRTSKSCPEEKDRG